MAKKRIYVPVSEDDLKTINQIATDTFRSKAYVAAWLLAGAVKDSKK